MGTPNDWNTFARVNAAQRWRRSSAAMGRPMTETLVAAAEITDGLHVLDVASGTGEPAISIASLLRGTGHVTATDLSSEPLAVAQQRAQERDLHNISFEAADVHALPFPEATFDRVTCRLGVMFFANLPRALAEILRVLKDGGKFVLVAWGSMQQPYFQLTIGSILQRHPELTIPPSAAAMFRFAVPGTLKSALQLTGFRSVDERQMKVDWSWPGSPEDLWGYFQEVTVPFKPLLQSVPMETREALNREIVDKIRKHFDGNLVRLEAEIILGTATK